MGNEGRRSSLTTTLAVLMVLGPVLAGGKCECKSEPDQETDAETDSLVQDIQVPLQIVSIEPDNYEPEKSFEALIFGAGFSEGATVSVGSSRGESVSVQDSSALSVQLPGLGVGIYDVIVRNPDGTQSSLRQGLRIEPEIREDCSFLRLQFGFDESTLSAGSRQTLDEKMSCYLATTAKIRIEGHTDERGTVDYNLSLGQRRAETVRRLFDGSGVVDYRMTTVSYGKERPVNSAHNEAAWTQNRRVDIYANK